MMALCAGCEQVGLECVHPHSVAGLATRGFGVATGPALTISPHPELLELRAKGK